MTARPTPDDLVEIHLISQLKYRYLRCLDQKRWQELATVFTDDATASYGGGSVELTGRDAVVEFLVDALGDIGMLTSHRCTQPEIELTGPDEATGVWALNDVVVHTTFDVTITGAAFYTDRYRKANGEWRIAYTGYKRTYEEIFPRKSIDGLQVTAQWWATNGRSSLTG